MCTSPNLHYVCKIKLPNLQILICAGAESIGYVGVVHGLFPNGGADLVHHFSSTCNSRLRKSLRAAPEGATPTPQNVVKDALESRLRMMAPHKKSWPQALALMSLPQNVPTSLANLLTLVDDVCYHAGDRSVDVGGFFAKELMNGL